jgi:hypothetical protein
MVTGTHLLWSKESAGKQNILKGTDKQTLLYVCIKLSTQNEFQKIELLPT